MMKEKYLIRTINHNDVVSVVDIVLNSFDKDYLIPSIYRGNGIKTFISNEIDNPFSPYRYFIICDGDSIAGYAEFKIFESTSMAFLNIISTSNQYKGKGIGKLLLEYAKAFFLENGYRTIELDVYKSNLVALNYYAGFGFKQISSNRFYKIEPIKKDFVKSNIYLQNYPQYKQMINTFGFYFLDIVIEGCAVRLGAIENDIIIRGTFDPLLRKYLKHLQDILSIDRVYFIGSDCEGEESEFIDEIYRLELNLKG